MNFSVQTTIKKEILPWLCKGRRHNWAIIHEVLLKKWRPKWSLGKHFVPHLEEDELGWSRNAACSARGLSRRESQAARAQRGPGGARGEAPLVPLLPPWGQGPGSLRGSCPRRGTESHPEGRIEEKREAHPPWENTSLARGCHFQLSLDGLFDGLGFGKCLIKGACRYKSVGLNNEGPLLKRIYNIG